MKTIHEKEKQSKATEALGNLPEYFGCLESNEGDIPNELPQEAYILDEETGAFEKIDGRTFFPDQKDN